MLNISVFAMDDRLPKPDSISRSALSNSYQIDFLVWRKLKGDPRPMRYIDRYTYQKPNAGSCYVRRDTYPIIDEIIPPFVSKVKGGLITTRDGKIAERRFRDIELLYACQQARMKLSPRKAL